MQKKKLKLDRMPLEQTDRVVGTKIESGKLLTNRERKKLQEGAYLISLSKLIDERSLFFCSSKQLLALNDYSLPELVRFQGALDFFRFI